MGWLFQESEKREPRVLFEGIINSLIRFYFFLTDKLLYCYIFKIDVSKNIETDNYPWSPSYIQIINIIFYKQVSTIFLEILHEN